METPIQPKPVKAGYFFRLAVAVDDAAACNASANWHGPADFRTEAESLAVQRFLPLLGVQRKGLAQLSFVCP